MPVFELFRGSLVEEVPMGSAILDFSRFMLPAQIHRQHGFIDEQVEMIELFGGKPDLNET